MPVAVQVSLYPLRQTELSPAIDRALAVFRGSGLEVTPGPMSTIIAGDDDAVFAALRDAFRSAAENEVVMATTSSNTCPVPGT